MGVLSIGTNIQYIKYEDILTPFISFDYQFDIIYAEDLKPKTVVLESTHLLLSIGIQKIFSAGYSDIGILIGIGHDWGEFRTSDLGDTYSTKLTDYAYFTGINFYFPFLKKVNSTFGYRLVYIAEKEADIESTGHILRTKSLYHIFTLGISINF